MTTGGTTCVIGDIHGCFSSLSALLDLVLDRADTLVFLGDYIDRGPDSRRVIDLLLEVQRNHARTICLQGNHEFMLQEFLAGRDLSLYLEVGGLQTLASYGLPPTMTGPSVRAALPADHLAFFSDLPLYWQDQYAIYVHAGLEPGRHLSMQTGQWCLWARDRFIASRHDFGKRVIFGHTPFREPLVEANKIGIDTGAVYGGRLTALLLPETEFISVPGEQEHPFPAAL